MKLKYSCPDFRNLLLDSPFVSEAAEIFAQRAARREFGKSGAVGALHHSGSDGHDHHFSAYIGQRAPGGVSGHNITLIVTSDGPVIA